MNSLIQWNLNGLHKKIIYLKLLINNEKPSVICHQETNLKPNHNTTIKNYQGYFRKRQINPIIIQQSKTTTDILGKYK